MVLSASVLYRLASPVRRACPACHAGVAFPSLGSLDDGVVPFAFLGEEEEEAELEGTRRSPREASPPPRAMKKKQKKKKAKRARRPAAKSEL